MSYDISDYQIDMYWNEEQDFNQFHVDQKCRELLEGNIGELMRERERERVRE
jgi:hypothetical protein